VKKSVARLIHVAFHEAWLISRATDGYRQFQNDEYFN